MSCNNCNTNPCCCPQNQPNQVYQLPGPMGPQGPAGIQGNPGIDGIDGIDGVCECPPVVIKFARTYDVVFVGGENITTVMSIIIDSTHISGPFTPGGPCGILLDTCVDINAPTALPPTPHAIDFAITVWRYTGSQIWTKVTSTCIITYNSSGAGFLRIQPITVGYHRVVIIG